MRRIPSLPRFVGSVCGVLTLTFILSAAASAQEGAAKPAPTVPADSKGADEVAEHGEHDDENVAH